MTTPNRLHLWSRFLSRTRGFLESKGFVEVTTPHLVPAGAFEGVIDCLKVSHSTGGAELHSSPEMEMKRLLSRFRLPIYQICQCFRDDPTTPHHRREFTMLEFYRVDADWTAIIADVRELIHELCEVPPRFRQVSVADLFDSLVGVRLDEMEDRQTFAATLESRGVLKADPSDSWEDLFFKVLVEKIEPALDPDQATVVTGYPARIAALSGLQANHRYAERFEIYWRGMEICNGCTELGDLTELRRRISEEAGVRKANGKPPHPYPAVLVEAMEAGLPPCAGVAVGLNRLFACVHPGEPVFD